MQIPVQDAWDVVRVCRFQNERMILRIEDLIKQWDFLCDGWSFCKMIK